MAHFLGTGDAGGVGGASGGEGALAAAASLWLVPPDGAHFLVAGALVVALVSGATLRGFAHRDVSCVVFLTSLLGWLLSFGIVALVPFDVWESMSSADDANSRGDDGAGVGNQAAGRVARKGWSCIYWSISFLCWFLCPVMIEYESSNDFTVRGRLRASFRKNARCYLFYACCGLVAIVRLSQNERQNLRAWGIACSNAWGLLLSTLMMGHGLVAVPKHLWRLSSPDRQLGPLYRRAASMNEKRLSAQFELQDLILEARGEVQAVSDAESAGGDATLRRALGVLRQTLEECEVLSGQLGGGGQGDCSPALGRSPPRAGHSQESRIDDLGAMYRSMRQASLEARRTACRWTRLVARCIALEDEECGLYLTASDAAKMLPRCCRCCGVPISALWVLWLRFLRGPALRSCSLLCAALSGAIVLGQVTLFSRGWCFSLLAGLFWTAHGFWATQVLCVLPLGYMLCASYWSVFRLRIGGLYGMYQDHNTDACSLLWCASALARMTAPLCFHFLRLIRVEHTSFQHFMGQMKDVPIIGETSFNEIFPVLVGVVSLWNVLGVHKRLRRVLGWDHVQVEAVPLTSAAKPNAADLFAEGRRLIERERRRRAEGVAGRARELVRGVPTTLPC